MTLYCSTTGVLAYKQVTKPAPISADGKFTAAISDEIHGAAPVRVILSGRFSDREAQGTITTIARQGCSGSTTLTASRRG